MINNEICRLAAPKVTDDMVIEIESGDIRKRYAKKMEFLGKFMMADFQLQFEFG